jgi:hypothetical protein
MKPDEILKDWKPFGSLTPEATAEDWKFLAEIYFVMSVRLNERLVASRAKDPK